MSSQSSRSQLNEYFYLRTSSCSYAQEHYSWPWSPKSGINEAASPTPIGLLGDDLWPGQDWVPGIGRAGERWNWRQWQGKETLACLRGREIFGLSWDCKPVSLPMKNDKLPSPYDVLTYVGKV
jgi:hypothetical protein